MTEKNEDPAGFKVVDRRSFASDGTRVAHDPASEERQDIPPATAQPSHSRSPLAMEAESQDVLNAPASGFEALVSYLSTTALFQLGLLEGPSGERIPPDLASARRTVDLLEVLKHKTRGNLAADESKLLEDVLYELRMSFVELQNTKSPRRK